MSKYDKAKEHLPVMLTSRWSYTSEIHWSATVWYFEGRWWHNKTDKGKGYKTKENAIKAAKATKPQY